MGSRANEPVVTTAMFTEAERAAWDVAVERGVPITAADLRALLNAAAGTRPAGFVPAAALRSELDLLASQHQALGDAKHGQPEALEHLGRAAAFDQVKEILNSLEATR